MPVTDDTLTITLITALRECDKCRRCEAMVQRLQSQWPGRIVLRKVKADAPEAEQYGVIMPPMLVVGKFIAAAGRVPREDGLTRLVAAELEGDSRDEHLP